MAVVAGALSSCNVRRIIVAFLLAVTLHACGPPTPVYQVQHALTPPASDTGRLCAAQCLNTKQQCAENAKLRKSIDQDRCEDQARQDARKDYKRYVASRRAKGKKIKRSEREIYQGYSYSCRNKATDTSSCLENYHQCYTTCGGHVASKSICVANCDVPVTKTGSISQPGTLLADPKLGPNSNTVFANLPVAGTWGQTAQACSSNNVTKDGVLQISRSEIRNGMDVCVVDKMTPTANGMYHFHTRCQGAEGGKTYPAQFVVSAPTPNELTHDSRSFDRIEKLVRCRV